MKNLTTARLAALLLLAAPVLFIAPPRACARPPLAALAADQQSSPAPAPVLAPATAMRWRRGLNWFEGNWATLVLVVGALVAVGLQARSVARSRSAEAYLLLTERWDGEVMRGRRRRLAAALNDGKDGPDVDTRIADVIDFFEDVGTFTRLGYLKGRAAWEIWQAGSV